MPQNFYDMLGVSSKASISNVRQAYKDRLRELVRRKEAAGDSRSAMAVLYREERELREAMEVLIDPVRRTLYNSFRHASDSEIPEGEQTLWNNIHRSVIDPSCLYSVRLLASLTTLPLQDISLFQQNQQPSEPEDEKTEPLGTRPSSLKNSAQRVAVRESIEELTRARRPKPALDEAPTEVVPRPEPPPEAKQPVDTIRQRIPKPTNQPPPAATSPVAQPTSKPTPKPKATMEELLRRHGYSGALFKAIRENQGWTLQQLSQRTNVPVNYIQSIENEDFSSFSSTVFVRGVVKNISRALGIQERSTVEGFLQRMGF